jgi:asparagine N-glycosylation enzyme membrane subunit Stt3
MSGEEATRRVMSVRQARTIERAIVTASILALVLIFQPFSLSLFSLGAAAIVIVGLAFNLVPLCEPGKPVRRLVVASVVIVVIFAIVTVLALAAAEAYAYYIAPASD